MVYDLKAIQQKKQKRTTISGEVYGNFNKGAQYKPKVHTKTPDQEKAIRDRIKENFMFQALDLKDTKIIIDAIVP